MSHRLQMENQCLNESHGWSGIDWKYILSLTFFHNYHYLISSPPLLTFLAWIVFTLYVLYVTSAATKEFIINQITSQFYSYLRVHSLCLEAFSHALQTHFYSFTSSCDSCDVTDISRCCFHFSSFRVSRQRVGKTYCEYMQSIGSRRNRERKTRNCLFMTVMDSAV